MERSQELVQTIRKMLCQDNGQNIYRDRATRVDGREGLPFISQSIFIRCGTHQSKYETLKDGTYDGVPTRYNEIFANVTKYMRQRACGEDTQSSLQSWFNDFK